MLRSARAVALLVPITLLASGCVIVDADFKQVSREDRHFTVNGKPDLTLSTFDGPIEVRPWDKPEVQVTIEKRGRDEADIRSIEVTVEQNGNHITVTAKHDRDGRRVHFGWNMSRSAKLIVQAPVASDVNARSGDGSIDISGITGTILLHSGDGRIKATAIAGDVDVSTGDGSVTMDGKFDALRARSGDGSLRIQAARGSAAAKDWDITTGDGSVTLEIPDNFNADLDAHTGDGSIRLNDVSVSNVQGEIRRNTVKGQLGSGGSSVRIRTGDGSITVRRAL